MDQPHGVECLLHTKLEVIHHHVGTELGEETGETHVEPASQVLAVFLNQHRQSVNKHRVDLQQCQQNATYSKCQHERVPSNVKDQCTFHVG